MDLRGEEGHFEVSNPAQSQSGGEWVKSFDWAVNW